MWANWFFAPPPKPRPAQPIAQKKQPAEKDDAEKNQADPGELSSSDPEDEGPPEPEKAGDVEPKEPKEPKLPTELVAVGSMDPKQRYKLLAVFSTKGASLKRLELTDSTSPEKVSPRFRDVEIDYGYLGHLELQESPEGLRVGVNVEDTGSPAAQAGVARGDLVLKFNGQEVKTTAAYDRLLTKTKPREKVTLSIKKPDGATQEVTIPLMRAPQQLIRPDQGIAYGDIPAAKRIQGDHPYSFRFTLVKPPQKDQSLTARIDSLLTDNWKLVYPPIADQDSKDAAPIQKVIFEKKLTPAEAKTVGLSGEWTVEKIFHVAQSTEGEGSGAVAARHKAAQHLTWEIKIHNGSGEAQDVCSWIEGPTGLPSEGWWYSYKIHPQFSYTAGARDVVLDSTGLGYKVWGARDVYKSSYAKPDSNLLFTAGDRPTSRELEFIGVDTQYFAALLIPGTVDESKTAIFRRGQAVTWDAADKKHLSWAKAADISFNLQGEVITVEPDQSSNQSFVIFAGPKDPDLAAVYGVEECVYYGWFGIVSTPLLHVLHLFSFMGYGLAIIMLTLLVRACLWPLSRKAARNAQMMQVLKPEMDAIREKYKNDMEKQGQAQRELMAKYQVNPFGGCLLMFFQMPVFLGLYRGLSVDLELRDQPLIPGLSWAENLAAPDRLLYWGTSPQWLFGETGFLGPYLNILPLATVGLFIVQQKLFMPPATDDQTRAQQKVMNFMMILMGFMFFKVPSGLCLYFITTSIFSIAERLVLPPPKPPEKTIANASAKTPSDKPSVWDRLTKEPSTQKTPEQLKQEKKQRAKARQKSGNSRRP